MSEALTQHANPDDRGHASATLHNVMLPVLDEQEQASFLGVIRRLDTLGDAVVAMVSIDTVPLTLPFFSEAGRAISAGDGLTSIVLGQQQCKPLLVFSDALVSEGPYKVLGLREA